MAGCMNVRTQDGIEIYVLPETAQCMLTGKSPLDMDGCPGCIYGYDGVTCIPESCLFYTEERTERTCETCRHNLGGGYNNCRINLEAECADGDHEAWEPKEDA